MSYELYDINPPLQAYYLTHEPDGLTLRFEKLEEALERATVYYEQLPGLRQSIAYGTAQHQDLKYDDHQIRELLYEVA